MDHLYASAVRIERLSTTQQDGMPVYDWAVVEGGEFVKCRLDLNFLRPGKDIAPAPQAGKTPDRMGLMFCDPNIPLMAGDRIVTIPNEFGEEPVSGTFEIRVMPDPVVGFASVHHWEVQILETNQANIPWPGAQEDEED